MKKILQFLLFMMLMYTNSSYADGICEIFHPSYTYIGQSITLQVDECEECDNCYETYGVWTIDGSGEINVNGTTYGLPYTTSANPGQLSFTASYTVAGEHSIQYSTNGNCNFDECNEVITSSFTVKTPLPSLFHPPSNSIVSHNLIRQWNKAGYDKSRLPATKDCKPIYWCKWTRSPLKPFRDGYLVNVTDLNTIINNTANSNQLKVIYFPTGHYYFDKGDTIIMNRKNVVISGAGANNTKFHIIANTTNKAAVAKDFIQIKKPFCGVTCLSIDTFQAFNFNSYHNVSSNGLFKNKSIIKISGQTNCWVENVKIRRGYGCTVQISGGNHNSILGCDFFDQWTLGGTSWKRWHFPFGPVGDFLFGFLSVNNGGTQGYGVQITNSDYNLIENNRIGLNRHAVVIQGAEDNSSLGTKVSSFNIVSYNNLYAGAAKNTNEFSGNGTTSITLNHPYNITLHGVGKNYANLVEGNLCEDKISVDDDHGANGMNNTFYRNISKTQIEVQKIDGCTGNSGQRFVLNKVFRRLGHDRWQIKAKNHVIRGNSKCNSSGNNCDTSFSAGYCGVWPFGTNNYSNSLNSGQGQTCYLTSVPSFMSSLPVFNGTNNNSASNRSGVASNNVNCYSCRIPHCIGIINSDTSKEKAMNNDSPFFKSKIYPNPFTISSTLEINTSSKGILNMSIYSVEGRLIKNKNVNISKGNNKITLSRNNMNVGVYFINLRMKDKIETIKFIIK